MWREHVATGVVKAVLVTPDGSRVSVPQEQIKVDPEFGVLDDRHAGHRSVGHHDTDLVDMGVPMGTHIANVRQVTLLSSHELDQIGQAMKLPALMPAGCLAENIVVSGIASLTEELKPGALLEFKQHSDDPNPSAVLAVWGRNDPCERPEQAIVNYFTHGSPPFEPAMSFIQAAQGRRGVTGYVLVGGIICPRDVVKVWL